MSKCVQCQEEMERYGEFQGAWIYADVAPVFRCLKPKCPNYNLLAGESSINKE